MAEAILADALARLGVAARVRSAGTHAVPGPPSPGATVALRARPLDCSGHRSRRLRPEDVQSADLVLGMTAGHVSRARALVAGDPAAQAKIQPLDPEGDVDDPIGLGQRAYDELGAYFTELIPQRIAGMLGA